ncbi:MAG: hypothetical protein HQM02_07800 [Magnetococcales bacterium]|nr:hypothetical protein [Magnetococcales bacterium]
MRAIKIFVISGALVLLVGLGVLVMRIQGTPIAVAQTGRVDGSGAPDESLAIPPGARVTQLVGMDSSGVATLVQLADGGAQLLLFSAHGKLKRRISLTAGEVPPSAPRSPGN